MSGRSNVAPHPTDAAAHAPEAPRDAEVLIAGASFAGLAAAQELGRRAILVDPAAVGDGQTSACGAPVSVLEALGAAGAIQERHGELVLHLAGRDVRWPLPDAFCTFDYRRCCVEALRRTGADVRRAAVLGRSTGGVATSAGELRSAILIDCTGWRAALADGRVRARGPRPKPKYLGFGLEAEVPSRFAPGLHFYFRPDVVPDGYAWVFPAGATSRVGLLSYRGRTQLRPALEAFLRRLGMPSGPLHGGFLRADLRPSVVDGVFVAGDAAGQCLPLSGEGIRTAVWAGRACGRLVRLVLDGRLPIEEARRRYSGLVARQRRRYRVLLWATLGVLVLPSPVLARLASWVGRPGPLRLFMRHYLGVFSEYDSVDAAA